MGTRIWLEKPLSTSREEVLVSGSFAPAGTGAPTAALGDGYTVARTSTGLFTLTLDRVWPSLLSATATVQLATAADTVAQVGVVALTSKTVQIRTLTAGALADVAANANNRVNFALKFKRSGF